MHLSSHPSIPFYLPPIHLSFPFAILQVSSSNPHQIIHLHLVLFALRWAVVQPIVLLECRVDILVVLLRGLDDLLRDVLQGEAVSRSGGRVGGLLWEGEGVHFDVCVLRLSFEK